MPVLVDPHSGKSLGRGILGAEAGEIVAMLQLAMRENQPYHGLRSAVSAVSTLAESLNNLFANLEGV